MDFELKNRYGLNIIGRVEEPGRDKLAVVMHGLSGFMSEVHIQAMKDAYVESGYTVLLFDCTHSFGKSEGEYEVVTLTSFLEDLEDVLAWAGQQDWSRTPISMSGHSMGGYTVMRYAEIHPEVCESLVAFAPVVSGLNLEENRRQHNPESYKAWQETGITEEESKSRPGLMKRLKWDPHVTDSYKHDLLPDAARLTMPTMIIVGENDWPCPVEAQQQLIDAIGSDKKKLVIVPKAEHQFTSPEDIRVLKDNIKDWIKEH